jgi:hypothetical protein
MLNGANPDLPGAVQGRAAAHVLRLSMLYALVDGTLHIDVSHLLAALALWEYVEASALYIFDEDDDPKATRLLKALRDAGDKGLSRSDISVNVFQTRVKKGD